MKQSPNTLRTPEDSKANQFRNTVDRLIDHGIAMFGVQDLRATDQCVPFIPVLSDRIDPTRYFSRIWRHTSSTIGYAYRPMPGEEEHTPAYESFETSSYAVKFVTTHPDSNNEVTEALYHIVGDEVWKYEALYEADRDSGMLPEHVLDMQQGEMLRQLNLSLHRDRRRGPLITDYNWDESLVMFNTFPIYDRHDGLIEIIENAVVNPA